jgi:hypothetical protein
VGTCYNSPDYNYKRLIEIHNKYYSLRPEITDSDNPGHLFPDGGLELSLKFFFGQTEFEVVLTGVLYVNTSTHGNFCQCF